MNAYIKTPNRLSANAFSAFDGEEIIIKPQIQNKTKEYNELGDSLVSLDTKQMNTSESLDDFSTRKARTPVSIPVEFSGGMTGNSGYMKTNEAVKKDFQYEVRSAQSSGFVADDSKGNQNNSCARGKPQGTREIGEDVNRPPSKLIQDSGDLPFLFNALRGKEAEEPARKKIGSLSMPGIFKDANSRGKQGKEEEVATSNGTKIQVNKKNSFDKAIQVPFSEWRNERGTPVKDAQSRFGLSQQQRNVQEEEEGAANVSNNATMKNPLRSASTSNRPSGDDDFKQVSNISRDLWHPKQNDSQTFILQTESRIQNKQSVEEKYRGGINGATSYSQNMLTQHDMKGFDFASSATDGLQLSHDNSATNRQEDSTLGTTMKGNSEIEEIKRIRRSRSTENQNQVILQDDTNAAKKIVGKLKLPSTFSSISKNMQDKKQSEVKLGSSNHQRRSPNTANDVEVNTGRQQIEEQPAKYKAHIGQLDGKIEADLKHDKTITNSVGLKENSFSYNNQQTNPRTAVYKSLPYRKQESEEISEDKRVPYLKSEASDKETEDDQERPPKQVGRLNIQSIFAKNNTTTNEGIKKKEPSSFDKTKSMFSEKQNSKEKQKKLGKLRLSSTKSESKEELDNLTVEGETPSNMSTQMKVQLEKILQQRSASITSQTSLISPRNDTQESQRSSRNGMSSTRSSSSVLSLLDSNEDDAGGTGKVNSGSLKAQLNGMLQGRVSGGSSKASSLANSLDNSLSSSSLEEELQFSASETASNTEAEVKDERKEKRKMIAEAIKMKYGKKKQRDDGINESGETAKDAGNGAAMPSNTQHASGKSGTTDREHSGESGGNRSNDLNKSLDKDSPQQESNGFYSRFKTNDADRASESSANKGISNAPERSRSEDQDASAREPKRPKTGKLSIPTIFGERPLAENAGKVTRSPDPRSRSSVIKVEKMDSSEIKFQGENPAEKIDAVVEEAWKGDDAKEKYQEPAQGFMDDANVKAAEENKSRSQSATIKKLSIPSNFLGNTSTQNESVSETKVSPGRLNASRFMQATSGASAAGNGSSLSDDQGGLEKVNGKNIPEYCEQTNQTAVPEEKETVVKQVSFQEPFKVKEKEDVVATTPYQNAFSEKSEVIEPEGKKRASGRLSSSLFSAFQNNNDNEKILNKASTKHQVKATSLESSEKAPDGNHISGDVKRENLTSNQPVSNKDSSSAVTKKTCIDLNKNEVDWLTNADSEATGMHIEENQKENAATENAVNRRGIGKLNIPSLFK